VSRLGPDIFIPTGVLIPVESMSVRVNGHGPGIGESRETGLTHRAVPPVSRASYPRATLISGLSMIHGFEDVEPAGSVAFRAPRLPNTSIIPETMDDLVGFAEGSPWPWLSNPRHGGRHIEQVAFVQRRMNSDPEPAKRNYRDRNDRNSRDQYDLGMPKHPLYRRMVIDIRKRFTGFLCSAKSCLYKDP